jgi:hypothetical protein
MQGLLNNSKREWMGKEESLQEENKYYRDQITELKLASEAQAKQSTIRIEELETAVAEHAGVLLEANQAAITKFDAAEKLLQAEVLGHAATTHALDDTETRLKAEASMGHAATREALDGAALRLHAEVSDHEATRRTHAVETEAHIETRLKMGDVFEAMEQMHADADEATRALDAERAETRGKLDALVDALADMKIKLLDTASIKLEREETRHAFANTDVFIQSVVEEMQSESTAQAPVTIELVSPLLEIALESERASLSKARTDCAAGLMEETARLHEEIDTRGSVEA